MATSAASGKSAKPAESIKPAAACPICGKPVDPAHKPFCSKRCADVDLNRWLNGAYVIAGEDGLGDDDEPEDKASSPRPDGANDF